MIGFETNFSTFLKEDQQAIQKFTGKQPVLSMSLLGPGVWKVYMEDIQTFFGYIFSKQFPPVFYK